MERLPFKDFVNLPNWACWDRRKIPLVQGRRLREWPTAAAMICGDAEFDQMKRGLNGIGVIVRDGLLCFDVDGGVDPETDKLEPWAEQFVESLNTYTEYSPSRTGLHLFAQGKSCFDSGRILKLDVKNKFSKTPQIEIFDHGKFCTVTGDIVGGRDRIKKISERRLWNVLDALPLRIVNSSAAKLDDYVGEKFLSEEFFQDKYDYYLNLEGDRSTAEMSLTQFLMGAWYRLDQIKSYLCDFGKAGTRTDPNAYLNPMLEKSWGRVRGKRKEKQAEREPRPKTKARKVERITRAGIKALDDWIEAVEDTAPKPQPELTLAAAFGLMSAVLKNNYCLESGGDLYANLYLVMVNPTSSGKDVPRKAIGWTLECLENPREYYTKNAPQSKEALGRMLNQRGGSTTILVDEMGDWLDLNQGKSSNRRDIMKTIKEIATSAGEYIGYGENKDESNSTESKNTFLSFVGSTTEAQWYDSFSGKQKEDGAINRFFVVHGRPGKYPGRETKRFKTPRSTLHMLKTLRSDFRIEVDEKGNPVPKRIKIKWDYQRRLQIYSDDLSDGRFVEIALRFALMYQLAKDPNSNEIEEDAVDFAERYVSQVLAEYEKNQELWISDNVVESGLKKLVRKVTEKGGWVSLKEFNRLQPKDLKSVRDSIETYLHHYFHFDRIKPSKRKPMTIVSLKDTPEDDLMNSVRKKYPGAEIIDDESQTE